MNEAESFPFTSTTRSNNYDDTEVPEKRMKEFFRKFATQTSNAMGHPAAFIGAVAVIIVWALLGPAAHYSDTWQLVINTSTTIVTFLMVFLIQNAQNRDTKAIHLKLNELLRGMKGARNTFVDLEEMTDQELEELHAEFKAIHDSLHGEVSKRGLAGGKRKAAGTTDKA
jgi:low affinity Fe/Cu permease